MKSECVQESLIFRDTKKKTLFRLHSVSLKVKFSLKVSFWEKRGQTFFEKVQLSTLFFSPTAPSLLTRLAFLAACCKAGFTRLAGCVLQTQPSTTCPQEAGGWLNICIFVVVVAASEGLRLPADAPSSCCWSPSAEQLSESVLQFVFLAMLQHVLERFSDRFYRSEDVRGRSSSMCCQLSSPALLPLLPLLLSFLIYVLGSVL